MNNTVGQDNGIDIVNGERGFPNVNDSAPSTSKRALFIVTTLLFCGFAVGLGYWRYHIAQERKEAAQEQKLAVASTPPTRTFQELAPKQEATPVVPAIQGQSAIPLPQSVMQPPLPGTESKPVQPQLLDKSGSELMVTSTASEAISPPRPDTANNGSEKGDKEGLSTMLTPTKTEKRQASMIGNRNFLLAKGAIIECALQTKLITTVSGMTSCIISRDIYSDNGKVLLVERGSTITGEYQARLLQQGMARIFVLWDRIKTWNGVVIALDSPGTDALGGAGLPGYIDTHFWERFGSALMLSLITTAEQGLISSLTSGNGSNQYNIGGGYGSSGIQNMPAEALKYSINIPPTLYKNQGEQAAVYVARDLDFTSVYDVAVK